MAEDNPIATWVHRQVTAGYKGFELYRRESQDRSLVDRYPADKAAAEAIYDDAKSNAGDAGGSFLLQALNDGPGPHPSRSFLVRPPAPMHEPERFEDRNSMRLLLEHIDNQNRVISQVVPACLAAMGNMVQGLSAHFGTLAETHEAAIRTLRDSRVESLETERVMMLDAARQQRMDKLIDVGVAMLPQLVESIGKGKP